MSILLFVTAAMLAVSGALKLRSTSRIGLGFAPLALLEMGVAVGLGFFALPNPLLTTPLARWSVPAAVLLLIVSSIDHAVRWRRYRQLRAASEERRLSMFVKYMSGREGAGEDAE